MSEPKTRSRATRRYSRTAVDRALAGAIDRCKEIAADPTYVREVGTLAVFGSTLEQGHPDYGDLDLALDLPEKHEWSLEKHGTFRPALEHHAKHYPLFEPGNLSQAALRWAPEVMVIRRVRARSPVISFHLLGELEELGCPYRVVYKRQGPGRADT